MCVELIDIVYHSDWSGCVVHDYTGVFIISAK